MIERKITDETFFRSGMMAVIDYVLMIFGFEIKASLRNVFLEMLDEMYRLEQYRKQYCRAYKRTQKC